MGTGGFPQGGPGDTGFPGSQQDNRSGQWIQLAVWSTVLLAAVLIIRRVKSHNQ